jgi:hypothetical protein
MKKIISLINVIGLLLIAGIANAANEKPFRPDLYKVYLTDFSIDATNTQIAKQVACSVDEVAAGLINLISFKSSDDNSGRTLNPTYRPLDNDAAWFIDNKSCIDLAPYLNGIGFESYDIKTGNAVIYLAAFVKKENDENEWSNSKGDGYTRMRLLFQPEFNTINIVKFNANCVFVDHPILSLVNLAASELKCNIENGKGSLRLKVEKNKQGF